MTSEKNQPPYPANEHQGAIDRKPFSPREYLEARRPTIFSDSVIEQVTDLDRSRLEFHLHTLTSRNQESDFETFARKLAEHTICPNLIPQTGPMGGGDAKVDSETYPVAEDLALAWYVANSVGASQERWAFAISAMEDWLAKLRSDMQKIADTKRDYRKAFFISNQSIRSKKRANYQDELSAKHGFEVVILDRNWVLDRVFDRGLQQLAIEHLGIQGIARNLIRQGPLDLQREQDLLECDKDVERACKEQRFTPQLIDNAIESALTARSLERHVDEIHGRFDRAAALCAKCGTRHQGNLIAYHRAWTAAFWHEDYERFVRHYRELEDGTADTINPYEIELRTNLWFVLFSLIKAGEVTQASVDFADRTRALVTTAERLASQDDRPSASLQAKAHLLSTRLVSADTKRIADTLREYSVLIEQCAACIGFPLQAIAESLIQLGEHLGHLPEYQLLFETLVTVTAQRNQEVQAARLLLRRAAQQHDMGAPAEAIRTLGRAMVRLYKYESRDDIVRALYFCACCYEEVGLLWAARGTLLAAASIAVQEFWTYENVTALQGKCFNQLKWIELKLGRVPFVLAWHEIDLAVRRVLTEKGYEDEQIAPDEEVFDVILGLLLLRTDVWQLKWLETLPDTLDGYGLRYASLALRYALGPDCRMREVMAAVAKDDGAIEAYFLRWRSHPAGKELPDEPTFADEQTVTFRSRVLGCQVTVVCRNEIHCLALGESLLAALEAVLSTGIVDGVFAKEPQLTCDIRSTHFSGLEWQSEFTTPEGRPHLDIRCSVFDPNNLSFADQQTVKNQLADVVINLLLCVFCFKDLEETSTKLFRDDQALDRALHFCCSFVTAGGVLGNEPRIAISDWLDPTATRYPLIRSLAWDHSAREQEAAIPSTPVIRAISTDDPPQGLFDPSRLRHSDMEIVSLIRDTLWDRAGWRGTVFISFPGQSVTPAMAIAFDDLDAGKEIFKHWQKELGHEDQSDQLFVGIVRGISRSNPHAYRILLAANPATALSRHKAERRIAAIPCRIHRMDATTDQNLNRFLEGFENAGKFFLTYCHLPSGSADFEEAKPGDVAIVKSTLVVRDAWEIGKRNFEAAAIQPHGT
jgi:hypothetical protein